MEPSGSTSINKVASLLLVAFLSFGCSGVERSTRLETVPTNASSGESININMANRDELRRIPYIGERLADDIVDYREKRGPFRRSEHLMLLDGISDSRFREIRHLVRVD
jgi:competence protein ComEA